MKILIAGDTHGNRGAWKYSIFPRAAKLDCDRIFQVGDFGFYRYDAKYLRKLSYYTGEFGISIDWLDGNHEDFDQLEKIGAFGADGPVEVATNVTYYPRGYHWVWEGTHFMSLGGAYSINKNSLTPGVDWFPQEQLRDEDVERALRAPQVDVLLTHDAPMNISVAGGFSSSTAIPFTYPNREKVEEVMRHFNPKLLVHGHFHVEHTREWHETEIVGLNYEGRPGSLIALDAATLEWTWA